VTCEYLLEVVSKPQISSRARRQPMKKRSMHGRM